MVELDKMPLKVNRPDKVRQTTLHEVDYARSV